MQQTKINDAQPKQQLFGELKPLKIQQYPKKEDINKQEELKYTDSEQNEGSLSQLVKIQDNLPFPPHFHQLLPLFSNLKQQNDALKNDQKQLSPAKNTHETKVLHIKSQIDQQQKSLLEKLDLGLKIKNCDNEESEKSQSSQNSINNQDYHFLQQQIFQGIPKILSKSNGLGNLQKIQQEIEEKDIFQYQSNKHSDQLQKENLKLDQPIIQDINNIDYLQSEQQYQNYKNTILQNLKSEDEKKEKQAGLIMLPNLSQLLQKNNNIQSGEIISEPYHTYNSIGQLASNIIQDENLSLNINSKNAKIFYNTNQDSVARNLICFIENTQDSQQKQGSGSRNEYIGNNISLLVNQNDQIPNILSGFHQKGDLLGNILDFTIRKFRYLYLLYAKSVVVIDIKDLILSKSFSSQNDTRIVDSIQLVNPKQKDQNDQSQGGKNDLTNQQSHLFCCIEVAGDKQQSLLLFTPIASRSYSVENKKQEEKTNGQNIQEAKIMHIDCSNLKDEDSYDQSYSFNQISNGFHAQTDSSPYIQTFLTINSSISKQSNQNGIGKIMDIHIWDSYLAVLFEKSQIMMFDFKINSIQKNINRQQIKFENPIFKASYADARDQITQIFYIKDFTKAHKQKKNYLLDFDKQNEDLSNICSSQDSIENPDLKEPQQNIKKLYGHFLLIETKQKTQKNQNEKSEKCLNFRKLHIVQIQDTISGNLIPEEKKGSSPKRGGSQIKQNQQSLYQIDQLTFTESCQKLVSYDGNRGIVFLMNNELQDRNIRLFTVKLKKEVNDDSESDDNSNIQSLYKIRFEYVTEVKLKLSNQSFSAIQQVVSGSSSYLSKQPQYLLILNFSDTSSNAIDLNGLSEDYFIYTNISDQVIVFKRMLSEMIPTSTQMVKVISQKNTSSILNINQNKHNLTDDEKVEQNLKKSIKKIKEKEKTVSESSSKINENNVQPKKQNVVQQNLLLKEYDQNIIKDEEKNNSDLDNQLLENQDQRIDEIQQEKQGKGSVTKKEKNKKKKEEKKTQNKINQINTSQIEEDLEALTKLKAAKDKKSNQQQNNNVTQIVAQQQQQQKKNLKQQEFNIIENFGELTKKYQELALKTNQLQQLLGKQQQQKTDVEQAIKKAVQDAIGEKVIGEQLRDTVVPMLTSRIQSVGDFVHANVLPKIEKQIESLFNSYLEADSNFSRKQNSQLLNPQVINKIIQKEFKSALENEILPELEKSIKQILESLDKKLNQIDVALCEKLSDEDERWKEMQNNYNNSLQWLKQFHKKMGGMAQDMIRQQIMDQANNSKAFMAQQMKLEINNLMQSHLKQEIQSQVAMQVQKQLQSGYYPQYQQQYVPQQPPFQNLHSPSQLGVQPQFSALDQRMKFNQSYQYPMPNQVFENPNQLHSFYSQDQYSFTNKDQDKLYRENLLLKQENEKQKMELNNIKQQYIQKPIILAKSPQIQQQQENRKQNHPLDSFITQSKKALIEDKKIEKSNLIFEELEAERGYEEEDDFDDAEYGKDQYLQNYFDLNRPETVIQNKTPFVQFNQEINEKPFGNFYEKAEEMVNEEEDEDYIEAGTKYMKDSRVKQFNNDNTNKQTRRKELNRFF